MLINREFWIEKAVRAGGPAHELVNPELVSVSRDPRPTDWANLGQGARE